MARAAYLAMDILVSVWFVVEKRTAALSTLKAVESCRRLAATVSTVIVEQKTNKQTKKKT